MQAQPKEAKQAHSLGLQLWLATHSVPFLAIRIVLCLVLSAEMADAYAKRIETQYVGKSSDKDSELNKRLRRDELGETGNKREKCLRIASFLIRRGLGLEHA